MTAWPLSLYEDLKDFTLGPLLGEGVDRKVFVAGWDDRLVIKVAHGNRDFQNIAEWNLWYAAGEPLRKYLGPIYHISPNGRLLLAARCEPCPEHMLPEKWPALLVDDLHDLNIGLFDGHPVAMDYGRTGLETLLEKNAKALMRLVQR